MARKTVRTANPVITATESKGDLKKIETRKGTIAIIPGVKTEILTTLVIEQRRLFCKFLAEGARAVSTQAGR